MKKWLSIFATTILLSSTLTSNVFAAEEIKNPQLFNLEEADGEWEEMPEPIFEAEPNNNFDEANEILLDAEVNGTITNDDSDFYKIEITEKGYFYLFGAAEGETDEVVSTIYDKDLNMVNEGGFTEGNFFYDETFVMAPGTYYIEITDTDTNTNQENYTFSAYFSGPEVKRIEGLDRYSTAVKVAYEGWEQPEEIVLATGQDFPDALAAGPLAYQLDAPILLTRTKELPESVKTYIDVQNVQRVTIIGGPGAVSAEVEKYLRDTLKLTVKRIAGIDRFETAVKIADQLTTEVKAEAFVVNGRNFPDALSVAPFAAALGAPILLSETNALPASTATKVKQYSATYVVGGAGVVTDFVKSKLPTPERIGGINRYETSVLVAEFFKDVSMSTNAAFVTTGEAFPDALAASVLAGFYGEPIILTTPTTLHASAEEYFQANNVLWYTIIGGTGAVSDTVEQKIKSLMK
jgi:putative cell wall-binding protein